MKKKKKKRSPTLPKTHKPANLTFFQYFSNERSLRMTIKQTLKYYLLTALLLLIGGTLLSVILSVLKNDNHILVLILVGTLFAVIGCSLLNLMYFLPQSLNKYKFILPGILSVIIVAYEYRMNAIDLIIFEFYGVTNLILGIIWTSKINSKPKEKNTNTA